MSHIFWVNLISRYNFCTHNKVVHVCLRIQEQPDRVWEMGGVVLTAVSYRSETTTKNKTNQKHKVILWHI